MMETFLIILGSVGAFGALIFYAYITELRYWLPSNRNQHEHGTEGGKAETASQPHSLDAD